MNDGRPELDRRLTPTRGVLVLIGQALLDLFLLVPRLLLSVVRARAWQRTTREWIVGSGARDAP